MPIRHCVPRSVVRSGAIASLLWAAPSVCAADEILRQPPPLYSTEIAAHLTPVGQVIHLAPGASDAKADGITLLDEYYGYVLKDGHRTWVLNLAYKALTEAGAKSLAEQTIEFRKGTERFYLVQAETIQPDGSVQQVAPSAVLVETPQKSAQYSVYDDKALARIIFPNVKPGSTVHLIAIDEDVTVRMPGEFECQFTWTGTWPIGEVRYVLDLPRELASRLKINNTGTGLPALTVENRPAGHKLFTWKLAGIAGMKAETNPAPASQVGPCIHATTISDWNRVGTWFDGLAKDRDVLAPGLAALSDSWIKGETNRDAIIRILYDKIANDVRYTGLELGDSDYQPHDCNEVWKNQYGDCKDKANLLAALLRHHGIAAQLALLNAENAGLVDRRSPNYGDFNHVIVALPDSRGGFEFCDPTIEHGRPGLLGPGDADRDLLAVGPSGSQWVHTPGISAGNLDFGFDLNRKATGELSGWLTLTATGYFAASEESWFQKLDANETRQRMYGLVQAFFPNGGVVDVEKPGPRAADQPYVVRAYCVFRESLESGTARQLITTPKSDTLFMDLGYSADRVTPFYLVPGKVGLTCSYSIPPGWAPAGPPEPFVADTPAGRIRGQWGVPADGKVRLEVGLDLRRSVLSPDEFALLFNTVQAFKGWLQQPLVLAAGTAPAPPPAAEAELTSEEFPRMPTADGQLTLADAKFPANGDPKRREAALEMAMDYFPEDKSVAFRVAVAMAELDLNAGRKSEAASRIRLALLAYQGAVPPNVYAWGRLAYGLALSQAGRDQDAVQAYLTLAHTQEVDDQLRGLGALGAADILRRTSPSQALTLLNEAASWKSTAQPGIQALAAYLLLRDHRVDLLDQRLASLVQSRPADAADLLTGMVRVTESWNAPEDGPLQDAFFTRLVQVAPQFRSSFEGAMELARAKRSSAAVLPKIQSDLRQAVASGPVSDWYRSSPESGLKSDTAFDQAITAAQGNSDLAACLHLSVEALLAIPVDAGFPLRLRRAALYADMREEQAGRALNEPIFLKLLDEIDRLPPESEPYQSGRLARAEHLERIADWSGVETIYRGLIENARLSDFWKPIVFFQFGQCLERKGDFEGALVVDRRLEPLAATTPIAADGLLRATFINLQLHRFKEAKRLIGLLAAVDGNVLSKAQGAAQIGQFIALLQSGGAEKFWAASAEWNGPFETFTIVAGFPKPGVERFVPEIINAVNWDLQINQSAEQANRSVFMAEAVLGISAARWIPANGQELYKAAHAMPKVAPELAADFRKLLIRLLEKQQEPFGSPATLRGRQVVLAQCYYLDGKYESSRQVAAAFHDTDQPQDFITQRMDFVWAGSLQKVFKPADAKRCAASLRNDLKCQQVLEKRSDFVLALARLYRSLGRRDDEIALLRQGIEFPDIKRDAASVRTLTTRLDKLILGDDANSSPTARPTNDVYDISFLDRIPQAIVQVRPAYPDKLRAARVSGQALVDFIVDTNGDVRNAFASSATAPEFGVAAAQAVSRWKFRPGQRGTVTVNTHMQVPIVFAIH